MTQRSEPRKWRWAVLFVFATFVASLAIGQSSHGNLIIMDPVMRLQQAVTVLQARQTRLENALLDEIKARKDLEKQVAELKKQKPVAAPAKKG